MKRRPYIGVTGFTNRAQVEEVLHVQPPRGWALMIGVLANTKTLTDKAHRHPNRHVGLTDIRRVFVEHPTALNIIHFTGDHGKLNKQLDVLNSVGGPDLHGFQINMPWPDPQHLAEEVCWCDRIILQIGSEALRMQGNDPEKVARALDRYHAVVTDILIDESGGKGVPLDPASVIRYFEAIASRHNDEFGLGYAGGLSRHALHLIDQVQERYPTASIDAQGKMRDPYDYLSMTEVVSFLTLGTATVGRHTKD